MWSTWKCAFYNVVIGHNTGTKEYKEVRIILTICVATIAILAVLLMFSEV